MCRVNVKYGIVFWSRDLKLCCLCCIELLGKTGFAMRDTRGHFMCIRERDDTDEYGRGKWLY